MTDKPSVLFVCVHNAGRSQMAAGWLRHLAADAVEVRSAGSEPADRINPAAVQAMREVGIDIADQTPTKLTWDTTQAADVIITMGCGDACPVFPGTRYEDWKLDDPAGLDLDAVRPIRDDIERRVRTLLDSLANHPRQGLQQTSLLGTTQHHGDGVRPGLVTHQVDQR
jgi:arsenate reductase